MLVGTIAYECHSGLAHLARDFYRHGVVHRAMVVEHRYPKAEPGWFRVADRFVWTKNGAGEKSAFLDGLTHLMLFENALAGDWALVKAAKEKGVKIAIMPMHEWSPFPFLVEPDLVACPSSIDLKVYGERYGSRCKLLQVPVDTEVYPWRLRERATVWVHNMGHGQHELSKGTETVIRALPLVRAEGLTFVLRGQPHDSRTKVLGKVIPGRVNGNTLEVRTEEVATDAGLYAGDVFFNAEQFNGLSLPLQEAHASGMMIVTTDRVPANEWLPGEGIQYEFGKPREDGFKVRVPILVKPKAVSQYRIPSGSPVFFERCSVEPADLAATIDAWAHKDIRVLSYRGREWARENSWQALKATWIKALGEC